jgi:hypothetical protein
MIKESLATVMGEFPITTAIEKWSNMLAKAGYRSDVMTDELIVYFVPSKDQKLSAEEQRQLREEFLSNGTVSELVTYLRTYRVPWRFESLNSKDSSFCFVAYFWKSPSYNRVKRMED